jgi:hypothetical protein
MDRNSYRSFFREINLESHQVVRIFPKDFLEEFESPVGVYIAVATAPDLNQAIKVFEGLTKTSSDARFISSTNTTLSG